MLRVAHSGIPRFVLNLADQLIRQAPEHHFLLITGQEPPQRLAGRPNAEFIPIGCPIYGVREQWAIPRLLRRLRPDLFHATTYAAPLLPGCPMVMNLYDLIPMRFAGEYKLRHRLYYPLVVRRTARRAACVITISECSRSDIHSLLGVPLDRIVVIPPGIEPAFFAPPLPPPAAGRPYVLAMGNDKPHKNMAHALDAFETIAPQCDLDLVLLGRLSRQVSDRLRASRWAARIRHEHAVPDDRLMALYRGARLFVFPSLYEGFGLPPLEAMACGTPVVAFDAPAVVEACGDAAAYAPLGDSAALAEIMRDLAGDEQRRNDMIAAGRRRAARFTWAGTARRVLELYRRVLP